MKTVFVTGGIGSGKSAVCRYLESRGVMVYDSDSMTKSIYERDKGLVCSMESVLGQSLRDSSGKFDRQSLAKRIFSDPAALAAVEDLVHPAVLRDFMSWKRKQRSCGYGKVPFVVMESAIVLEKPLFSGVADKIILVQADRETMIARASERDNVPREEIIRRMESQHFDESLADAVIINDSDLVTLHRRTGAAFRRLW